MGSLVAWLSVTKRRNRFAKAFFETRTNTRISSSESTGIASEMQGAFAHTAGESLAKGSRSVAANVSRNCHLTNTSLDYS
jgi:hypothetical protein